MNRIKNSQILYVDSRKRIQGTDSDFSIHLDFDTSIGYDRCVVLDASLPKTYYLVQDGANSFQLTEDDQTVSIVIPVGNYNRSSFRNVLKAELNSNSPYNFTYNVSYNNIQTTTDDGKYLFTVTGNGPIQPVFSFGESLFEIVGFEKNSINYFVNDSLKSLNVPNFQKESTIFIHSDIVQNHNDNILQNIVSNGSSDFSFMTFQQYVPYEYSKPLKARPSNVFTFKITDENGLNIDFNGLNVLITIMLFTENKIDDLISDFIKLSVANDQIRRNRELSLTYNPDQNEETKTKK